jgi:hypothetical protein
MVKCNIFLLLSVIVAVAQFWLKFPLMSTLWGILLAVAYYYWGRSTQQREDELKALRKTLWYSGPTKQTVVDSI